MLFILFVSNHIPTFYIIKHKFVTCVRYLIPCFVFKNYLDISDSSLESRYI